MSAVNTKKIQSLVSASIICVDRQVGFFQASSFMAFDFPDGSIVPSDCDPWDEEILPKNSRPHSFGARFASGNDTPSEFIMLKSPCEFHRKQELVIPESSRSNIPDPSRRRTIEDLPSALISEILQRLNPQELGILSCVSTFLNRLASDHQGWENFYFGRWGPPPVMPLQCLDLSVERAWKELFVEREFRSKAFMGRYRLDVLHGHTEAVRSIFILSSAKLIFTGGYDSVVRMWDMEHGLCIATSQPLGCTIRAISADNELLVAGCTDAFLQCWCADEGHQYHHEGLKYFSNDGSEFRLWGHYGPITCIALDSKRIFSGSWDTSIRVWDRKQHNCVNILWHHGWVWSLVSCGSTVASGAGSDAYVWDIESGDPVNVICGAHSGNVCSVAQSYSGDFLFTGGEDGCIHMFDTRKLEDYDDMKPHATWMPHDGPVNSLAFEFPWLVSSSSDGRISLIDVRKLLKSTKTSSSKYYSRDRNYSPSSKSSIEPPQRMLHGFGCLYSVNIGENRIVCGGEDHVVRIWDFSKALEMEKKVLASKKLRLANRMRRRKAQNEMNSRSKGRKQGDPCSIAAKKNQVNGNRSGVWHSKCGVSGKLKG